MTQTIKFKKVSEIFLKIKIKNFRKKMIWIFLKFRNPKKTKSKDCKSSDQMILDFTALLSFPYSARTPAEVWKKIKDRYLSTFFVLKGPVFGPLKIKIPIVGWTLDDKKWTFLEARKPLVPKLFDKMCVLRAFGSFSGSSLMMHEQKVGKSETI